MVPSSTIITMLHSNQIARKRRFVLDQLLRERRMSSMPQFTKIYRIPSDGKLSSQRLAEVMNQQNHQSGQRRTISSKCLPCTILPSQLHRNSHYSSFLHGCQQHRRYKSIFVSKHNLSLNVTSKEIIEYCESHGIVSTSQDYRITNTHVILRECPFCKKPTNDKPDNLFKCYLHSTTGQYFCHRCGTGGSWFDWKLKLSPGNLLGRTVDPTGPNYNNLTSTSATSSVSTFASIPTTPESVHQNAKERSLPMPNSRLNALYMDQLPNSPVAEYLTKVRGLALRTLQKYGVGRGQYRFPSNKNGGEYVAADCVTFPWMMSVSDVEYQEKLRGGVFEWQPDDLDEEEDDEETVVKNDAANGSYKPKEKLSPTETVQKLKESTTILRRIKVRAIENKAWQRMDPAGGGWGLFGYQTIPKACNAVVLTEGEYDAMAVWQATGRPAMSLPNGCRSLPVEVLPLLEKFDKIFLWMDNDAAGQEGAAIFAKKIGLERSYIVRPTFKNCKLLDTPTTNNNTTVDETDEELQPDQSSFFDESVDDENRNDRNACTGDHSSAALSLPKDANDALRAGLDLEAIIADAKLIPHERITTFAELRSDVLHEILNPDKYVGSPITSLPGLTNIIKGLRRGEMTVLTGPTGSGKTTYLGQMSLDLVEQDINVLWGSFEIKNTRLMHKLLQQFAREPLPTGDLSMTEKLNVLADRFELLPFHFMKFHGGSDVDDVLDAMDYAVYVNDVEHIILDNMQFMVSLKSMGSRSTFDKFDMQDIAIEKFRKFATDRNVHVTLVVHPRKEQENTQLSMSSIYGSAKATQEADTVLILQSNGQKKFMEVKKNRFNGALGTTPLHFDRQSCRYSEVPSVPESGGAESKSESYGKSKATSNTSWDIFFK